MTALRNPREELFAHEVAAFTPVDRAYLAAGYESDPRYAKGNGCRLMKKPRVARRIDELRADFRAGCALNVEYLQALLLPLVESNVLDFLEPTKGGRGVKWKKLDALPRDLGRAISTLKVGARGKIEDLRLANKADAARTLLASLGIVDAIHNHNHLWVNLGDRLTAALARADEHSVGPPRGTLAAPDQSAGAAGVAPVDVEDPDEIMSA